MQPSQTSRVITYHPVEQGSPAWHKLRQEVDWTGSTVIYLLRGKPRPPETGFTSKGTEHGKFFEQQALLVYKMETGNDYRIVGFVTNSKYGTCGYSPDAIATDLLLEVKCFYGKAWDDAKKGIISPAVIAQIQFGMMICELKRARLLIYNPKDKERQLIIIDIKRDPKVIANIKAKLKTPS
jgi:hypothetical protein